MPDAELVSIDRQRQCILLSDQTRVQYGLLVLTVGLQPSCSLAAHQPSHDSQQVCSLQDLQHRTPKDTAAVENIIFHGATFEAYAAMQQLQAAGVDLAKVQHIMSAVEATGISAMLQEAAGLAGVTLPASQQVTDFSLQPGETEGKVGVTYTTATGQQSLQADLVVMASAGAVVPDSMAQAAAQSNLVCDGRLVVDAAFRTTDPNILAAGTAAKFSRRYGDGLCHSLYSSQEVGQRAADSIVATFNSPFLADSALPRLRRGRLFTTAVPGGGVFAYVCAAGMRPPNSLDAQGGTSLVSKSEQGYFQLTVDANSVIQSALLCSSVQQDSPPEGMLLPLVGLPVIYLHDLLHSYDSGKVPDLPGHLQQPWAALLYHDQFPQLRLALAQHVEGIQKPLQEMNGNSVAAHDQGAVTCVQDGIIEFVKHQGVSEFPQYDVAAFVP